MTSHLAHLSNQPASIEAMLDALQRDAFEYFQHETNPVNGLVVDKTQPGAPASIAAVGFALAAYPVGVERSWMTRAEAAERTLTLLRFFWNSPQGTEPDATGYKGFYYHFLNMNTGRRAGRCELSTIDTAFLLAGMLTAAAYFDQDGEEEREIRTLADALYRRADWQWARNGGATVTHGWNPEGGFLNYRWEGYDEALILYVLGLGSLHTSGRRSMGTSCCTAARSSSINTRTCGSISAESRMPSCATRESTISRIAGERPTFSSSMRFATLWNL